MRRIINLTNICLLLTLFAGCKNLNNESNLINMSSFIGNEVDNNLQELGMVINYVPLETSDSILLDGELIIKYMDSTNIIVESERELYRFDSNGKFLNKIGRHGQGPGEYIAPGRVSFDPVNGCLCLFTNKSLQYWSLDGRLIESLDFPDVKTLQSVSAMMNDTLLVVRRDYGDNGELAETIQWYDRTGKILHENDMLIDSTEIDIAMFAYPEHYRIGNIEYYRDEWDNKLYTIRYPEISAYRVFDFGRYNSDRSAYQSGSKMEKRGDTNVVIQQCIAAKGNVWMKYLLENRYNYILIGSSGGCLFHSIGHEAYSEPKGITLDGNLDISFWPSYIDDSSRIACVMYPEDMDLESLDQLSKELNTEIKSGDNPIIAILP